MTTKQHQLLLTIHAVIVMRMAFEIQNMSLRFRRLRKVRRTDGSGEFTLVQLFAERMSTGRVVQQLICGERVAGEVFTTRVAPYVEPPRDKALEELLGESLLIELLGK
jgi:hypothetical protein